MSRFHLISRRGLLRGTAAGLLTAGSGLAWPRLTAAAEEADVIVIGAGAAGLAAARTLANHGRTCMVLEAQDRIGGRMWTRKFAGTDFDYGGSWIHSANLNPIYPFAQEKKFRLVYQDDSALGRVYWNDGWMNAKAIRKAEQYGKKITSIIEDVVEEGEDIAASDALEAFERKSGNWPLAPAAQIAAAFIGPMDVGVDLKDLSTADYDNMADADPNYLVEEGFGTVIAEYGRGIPVNLNEAVKQIDYRGNRVAVTTSLGRTLLAKTVIVTVSVGVLKKTLDNADFTSRIVFSPALPGAKQEAVKNIQMGLLTKIPMEVTSRLPFGDLKVNENIMVRTPDGSFAYILTYPFDKNLLVGFVGGEAAWKLAAKGKPATIAFMKGAIEQVFGKAAAGAIGTCDVTDWATNPWTLGAYSAASPGQFKARAALKKPLHQNNAADGAKVVFFAGEAVGDALVQTCGGAVLSGVQAADAAHAAIAKRFG